MQDGKKQPIRKIYQQDIETVHRKRDSRYLPKVFAVDGELDEAVSLTRQGHTGNLVDNRALNTTRYAN